MEGAGQKKNGSPYLLSFLSYSLNTKFEHKGMNTGATHRGLK